MKNSLEDRRSRVESITSAVLAAETKDALWRHDCGGKAMQIAQPHERLRLSIETGQQQARSRRCFAGIQRSHFC